jgi:hypothetical protein
MTHAGLVFHARGNISERVQKLGVKTLLDLLNRPQWEKLSCFKAGILVVGKVKPTRVIPPDLRLILPEIESIKCAWIIFVPDLDGYKILLIYSGDTYDLCGNWGHLRYL